MFGKPKRGLKPGGFCQNRQNLDKLIAYTEGLGDIILADYRNNPG
ncbi:hypothetical protein [Scytonema sp. NUACC21]